MFDAFRQHLRELKKAEPGHRFQAYYEQRHETRSTGLRKLLVWGGAGLLLIVGLIMIPAPGPGVLVVAGALSLLAGESQLIAQWLDRSELNIRRLISRLLGTA